MNSRIESSLVIERAYQADVEDLWALWTTRDGFESWWGPQGFRADVHLIEARPGGSLHYDMVADTPAMITAKTQLLIRPLTRSLTMRALRVCWI